MLDSDPSQIAFNLPFVPKKAQVHLDQALRSPIQQVDGELSRLYTEKIQGMYPGFKCLLVPSCSSAIELGFMLLNLKIGDEVIW